MTERQPPTIAGLIASRVLDAELAGLLWLLLGMDLPLVVSGQSAAARQRLADALEATVAALGAGNAASERQLWLLAADSLEGVFAHFAAPPLSWSEDRLRSLGLVLIVGELPGLGERVLAAHYLRPVERDVGGHLQRRPPALLAALDREADRLEHFGWAITTELAQRIGLSLASFEASLARRRVLLTELASAGRVSPEDVHQAADEVRRADAADRAGARDGSTGDNSSTGGAGGFRRSPPH